MSDRGISGSPSLIAVLLRGVGLLTSRGLILRPRGTGGSKVQRDGGPRIRAEISEKGAKSLNFRCLRPYHRGHRHAP